MADERALSNESPLRCEGVALLGGKMEEGGFGIVSAPFQTPTLVGVVFPIRSHVCIIIFVLHSSRVLAHVCVFAVLFS